jgi:holliday junction DNA helicase RuvA
MISFLSGKIILKQDKFVIINVNDVGYKVFLSFDKIKLVQKDKDFSLFCSTRIKKDFWELYGFLSLDELEFFEFLITIPGIGPKAALEISSLGSLEKFKKAVELDDEEVLNSLFLFSGKKKAQAIIFEISRKIKIIQKKEVFDDETVSALLKLGFSKKEANESIKNLDSSILKTEDKIKAILKELGNKKEKK